MNSTERANEMSGNRQRILVVEDEPYVSRSLQALLTHYAYEVMTAGTVAGGLEALAAGPDVVLLDLGLPDGSGLTVLRQIRQRGLECEVIVISGETDEAQLERVRLLRPAQLLRKPVDFLYLLSCLRRRGRWVDGVEKTGASFAQCR